MLPEEAPPVRPRGALKWLRENLFSTWLNAILTIVSLYVVYWMLNHVTGWAVFGIWDAGSPVGMPRDP
jgi:general L-amino acid transport system permease protein